MSNGTRGFLTLVYWAASLVLGYFLVMEVVIGWTVLCLLIAAFNGRLSKVPDTLVGLFYLGSHGLAIAIAWLAWSYRGGEWDFTTFWNTLLR